jgi:hypothetical protein
MNFLTWLSFNLHKPLLQPAKPIQPLFHNYSTLFNIHFGCHLPKPPLIFWILFYQVNSKQIFQPGKVT